MGQPAGGITQREKKKKMSLVQLTFIVAVNMIDRKSVV